MNLTPSKQYSNLQLPRDNFVPGQTYILQQQYNKKLLIKRHEYLVATDIDVTKEIPSWMLTFKVMVAGRTVRFVILLP